MREVGAAVGACLGERVYGRWFAEGGFALEWAYGGGGCGADGGGGGAEDGGGGHVMVDSFGDMAALILGRFCSG